jgi:DNA mismatch repair protein MutS
MKDTPAMLQYRKIKKDNPGVIILFRMGDFYEIFDEDAKLVSEVLNITLTSRDKSENKTPMAGFPYHALDNYLDKLISNNFKVGICEQMEDPKSVKGVVKRDLVKIITPGTYISNLDRDNKENIFIMAINETSESLYGVSFIDFVSGEFYITDILTYDTLKSFISTINPKELILNTDSVSISNKDNIFYSDNFKKESLLKYFPNINLDKNIASLDAAGAIVHYLEDTQKVDLNHIKTLKNFNFAEYMILDENTIRSLEIFRNIHSGTQEGSLISVIDRTSTSMGSRKLRFFFLHPLLDSHKINERLDSVQELIKWNIFNELRLILKEIYDIERIATKIGISSIMPRDLLALKVSITKSKELKTYLSKIDTKLISDIYNNIFSLKDIDNIYNIIDKYIEDGSPLTLKDGGFIKAGIDSDLDKYRQAIKEGRNWILNFQQKEKEKLKIPSLKVNYNRVFGYYIEVSNIHKDKVPDNYIRKQTLTNAERYISQELKEYEDLIVNAESRSILIENNIFLSLKEEINKYINSIQIFADSIGYLDVLVSFAIVAVSSKFIKPEINIDNQDLEIIDGRHPVIEEVIKPLAYIPNDIILNTEKKIMIISGPNMSGKSSILRQTAIIVILSQIGSFIPSSKARIPIVDRVFTRVGSSDNLAGGESTFMVEMNEVSNILNNATDKSLIILDEIGRGTSTFDGVSIAWSIIEYIHDNIKAKTIIATHYHELLQLEDILSSTFNMNIMVKEDNKEIIFLRKLKEGGTDRSYGIHVAKLAKLPDSLVNRAFEILSQFENKKTKYNKKIVQESFFKDTDYIESEIEKEIKNLDLNTLTPIDAFAKLLELKNKL